MLCSKCGSPNADGAKYCARCGLLLVKLAGGTGAGAASAPAQAREPADISSAATESISEVLSPEVADQISETLHGVSGWLLFFYIATTIIAPLLNLAEIAANSNDLFIVVFDLALTGFAMYTGISVWRVRSNALKIVKAYFITLSVIALLVIITAILGSSTHKSAISSPRSNDVLTGLRTIVFVIIWWSYFERSRRVRATFGRSL